MTKDEIQKVVDDDINPGLAMHGGFISIHDFDEENKFLRANNGRRVPRLCVIKNVYGLCS